MSTSFPSESSTKVTMMNNNKPRILCLHGLSQTGESFRQKIGGARRKLEKYYDLDFLDAPLPAEPSGLGWWKRNEQGQHIEAEAAFEYVQNYVRNQQSQYDALLGFSQGGLLATTLALSGDFPHVRAVVTAGAPCVEDTFEIARQRALRIDENGNKTWERGQTIPKLHFAGETDTIIPVARVGQLCQVGGHGRLVLHEKGHLFPTKAEPVNKMMEFLEETLLTVN